jgi:hypothetical protein
LGVAAGGDAVRPLLVVGVGAPWFLSVGGVGDGALVFGSGYPALRYGAALGSGVLGVTRLLGDWCLLMSGLAFWCWLPGYLVTGVDGG